MRTLVIVVLLVFIAACVAQADPDPWPAFDKRTALASYVILSPRNPTGTIWDFYLSVSSASDPAHGAFTGIKALVIYPNGGNAEPALDGWTGYTLSIRPNWDANGGWHSQQGAYGYLTNSPDYYITPQQTGEFIGESQYPSGYVPPDHQYLVHVAFSDGYTDWRIPTIPEPGSVVIGLSGLIFLGSLIRRKPRT